MPLKNKVIGKYEGHQQGPLIFLLGAVHGNEHAGVKAIETLFKMLDVEPITNPSFELKGNIVGIIGNMKAYKKGKRYITKDLNRSWYPLESHPRSNLIFLKNEEWERMATISVIDHYIKKYNPSELIFLDLHTTSSANGVFSICDDSQSNIELATSMLAPVVLNIASKMENTSLHFFNDSTFNLPTRTLIFESGQHDEPMSVNRAIAAIVLLLKSVGCIDQSHVENVHEQILKDFAADLPRLVELKHVQHIAPRENFRMKPGYKNFQMIRFGETLASNRFGNIQATLDGLILMPLYQKLGDHGFYIVQEK